MQRQTDRERETGRERKTGRETHLTMRAAR